jgi:phage tail sheath gpL-like
MAPQTVIAKLAAELSAAANQLEAGGAVIGHLKGFLEPNEGSVTLSTTGTEVTVSGVLKFTLGITFIVYKVSDEEIKRTIAAAAAAALDNEVEIELCEHEHTHEGAHEHDYGGHKH